MVWCGGMGEVVEFVVPHHFDAFVEFHAFVGVIVV